MHQSEFNLIDILCKINQCADEISMSIDADETNDILAKYNDPTMCLFEFDDCVISTELLQCEANIKRVELDADSFDTLEFYKSNPIHRNFLKVYFCFKQKYKHKIIDWLIVEKHKTQLTKLQYLKERNVQKIVSDICQGLMCLHEEKQIAHNFININSIVGVQKLSKQKEKILLTYVEQMKYQLYDHNLSHNNNIFFDLPECNFVINKINRGYNLVKGFTKTAILTTLHPLITMIKIFIMFLNKLIITTFNQLKK
ncbi:hypothetical protein COBT_002082 [Conglomerata obtusa]